MGYGGLRLMMNPRHALIADGEIVDQAVLEVQLK